MFNAHDIKVIDCPRDAIQGIKEYIPTHKKIDHINTLIASGLFEYIDCGSFVSPKAVPQMMDTAEVLGGLKKINATKLLAIIANIRGATIAKEYRQIDYLGYPFSVSETFQLRNANSTIEESFESVKVIMDNMDHRQELVVYISMAFGNPYDDIWNEDLVLEWMQKLKGIGVKRFSIADTTGEATPASVHTLYSQIDKEFTDLALSIHLHSSSDEALEKINAAYEAGCRKFEGALMGYGGCPFAKDDLVGNIPTELLLERFNLSTEQEITTLKHSFLQLISK